MFKVCGNQKRYVAGGFRIAIVGLRFSFGLFEKMTMDRYRAAGARP